MQETLFPDAAHPPDFVALDFETADRGADSACAVALVRVERGVVVGRRFCLLKPPRRNFLFTYVHGIRWQDVENAPSFREAWPGMSKLLDGVEFLAAHNASFDRRVLEACCAAARLGAPPLSFRCTMQLARKTWGLRSASLPRVCSHLSLPLRHHDPRSDAEACAQIVVLASRVPVPVGAPRRQAPRRRRPR